MPLTPGESQLALNALSTIAGATSSQSLPVAELAAIAATEHFLVFKVGDDTTAITTGTGKVEYTAPFDFKVLEVYGSLKTASSSGAPAFDVNKGGTSVFTTVPTIDQSEVSTFTAATPAVLKTDGTETFAAGNELSIDIDTAGTGAVGLIVTLKVRRLS